MNTDLVQAGSPRAQTAIVTLLLFCLLLASSCLQSALADITAPASGSAAGAVVALVNGRSITASELDAHCAATGQPRTAALDDLIDLHLVRAAAAANRIDAPAGSWNEETRTRIEYALAKALSLIPPEPVMMIVVDHAWLKDAADEKGLSVGGEQLKQLRKAVLARETIPAAFARLQFDGSDWHIGDHEEYPADVLPVEVRNLPQDSISPVIAGDGGRHLFKIYQQKKLSIPAEEVRQLLRGHLYNDSSIEKTGDDLREKEGSP